MDQKDKDDVEMLLDNRLGYRNNQYKITVYPKVYPTGKYYYRAKDEMPTLQFIDEHYFVVLPVGIPSLPQDILDELKGIIETFEASQTDVLIVEDQTETSLHDQIGGRKVKVIKKNEQIQN